VPVATQESATPAEAPATAPSVAGESTGAAATMPGAAAPRVVRRSLRVGTPICFEDAYPTVARPMIYGEGGRKRAELLANVTNDGWFLFRYDAPWTHEWYALPVGWLVRWLGSSYQAEQEMQSAAFRCIENRVPMVRSVNTGVSCFIDAQGRIGPVVQVGGRTKDVDGWAVQRVALDPRGTLFGLLGQTPYIVMGLLTALWVLGGLWRPGKMTSMTRR
jgi:apolipoprotein N-acyltransferase